jgi:putative transposase
LLLGGLSQWPEVLASQQAVMAGSARILPAAVGCGEQPFWQARFYDFLVHSEEKRVEKLRSMHRNPVVRSLVAKPEEWASSSFRHYATGVAGRVEIESQWKAMRRGNQLPEYLRYREQAG